MILYQQYRIGFSDIKYVINPILLVDVGANIAYMANMTAAI